MTMNNVGISDTTLITLKRKKRRSMAWKQMAKTYRKQLKYLMKQMGKTLMYSMEKTASL